MNKHETSIPTSRKTRERLKGYGSKGETYDDLLNRMMDVYDEWERER